MAQVDFSWIAGLADPLIEAARKKQETDALLSYALPAAAATPTTATPATAPDRATALMGSAPAPTGPRPPTFAAIQGDQPSGKMADLIASAANKYGVDPNALVRMGQIESGLNPNAQNPNSSAGGLGQFINSTWAQYGGGASKFDPNANADAMARLARDNAAGLKAAIGRDPTPGELYLAHQQGLKGAINLLQNVNARASDVVGEQAVRLNGGTPDMTAGQFAALWDKKMGGAGAAPTAAAQPVQAGATPAAQAPASGSAFTPSPQERARWTGMIQAGGAARQLALQEIQEARKGTEFKVIGDQGAWVNPRTKSIEFIPNANKPTALQHVVLDGKAYTFDPKSGDFNLKVDENTPNLQHVTIDGKAYTFNPKSGVFNLGVDPGPDTQKAFDQESKLRGEFDKHEKNYMNVRDAYGRVLASVEHRANNPSTVSPASDMALVYGYIKMLDPNTGVKEGEYAEVNKNASIPTQILNMYNKAYKGEFLTAEQRQDVVNQASRLYDQARKGAEFASGNVQTLAKSYGVNPDRVGSLPSRLAVPDLKAAAAAPAAPVVEINGYKIRKR